MFVITEGTLEPSTVSTKQARIAELARALPGRRLVSLNHHLDKEWLLEACRQTRKDGAVGVISPLLSNIYLHHVLDLWFEQDVKPRLRGKGWLVRYADDFVMGFEGEDDARRVSSYFYEARRIWRTWLNRRSSQRDVTWEHFYRDILPRFPLIPPSIRHSQA